MTPRAASGRLVRPRIVPRAQRSPRVSPSHRGAGAAVPQPPGPAAAAPRRRSSPPASEQQGRQPASPIKEATWKWYIPLYFWLGGMAAGGWVAAAAEDLAGENDRDVVRAGRYLAAGSVLTGTVLLILDLGRSERFLNMLRIVRPRSTMSIGAWGLAQFGAFTGAVALMQAAEDGVLGRHPAVGALSRGWLGRVTHVAGLPAALFVGSYTGVLMGTTSTPSWARRARLLGPLFLASGLSSGLAAVAGIVDRTGGATARARQRLARAESIMLGTELVLGAMSGRRAASLPSARGEGLWWRLFRRMVFGPGMMAPLLRSGPLATGLTLAGGLALRYLIAYEGRRSARTPDDTWAFTAMPTRGTPVSLQRGPQVATTVHRQPARRGRRTRRGRVTGRITVAQEDRIRVVTKSGRGYLFTVTTRRASLETLAQWRDAGVVVRVRYRGLPDGGALAERIGPV